MKQKEATLRTKTALANALKEKMAKKSFSKITVSELIQECNINRKTFYYHFEDIYALLKWTFEQEAINVVKSFDLLVNAEEAINFVMDYIESNKYFINCTYDSIGYMELKRFLYTDIIGVFKNVIDNGTEKLNIKIDDDFKNFLADFYTEALAGMIASWVKGISHYNRQQIVQDVLLICKVSIPQILIAHSSSDIMNYKK
ncbi:MAG: TetR/AcrR family transcriptional regulator C-terminal domain-containing protein [Eubacteriales bacterium]